MKKKKVILVLLFICFSTIFLVFTFYNENNAIENGSTIEMQENTSIASLNSIKTSLTTSGEIVSGNTEKISLNTDYSFFTMCVEEGESVTEGQKLIKYTNGTYETAPFDGIITEYSVPTVNENCEANHYIEISSTQDLSVQISILEDQMSYIESGKEVEIGIQNHAYVQIVSGLSEENKIEVQETSTDNSNSFNNFMPGDGMGRQNMGDGNPPERIGETPRFNDK